MLLGARSCRLPTRNTGSVQLRCSASSRLFASQPNVDKSKSAEKELFGALPNQEIVTIEDLKNPSATIKTSLAAKWLNRAVMFADMPVEKLPIYSVANVSLYVNAFLDTIQQAKQQSTTATATATTTTTNSTPAGEKNILKLDIPWYKQAPVVEKPVEQEAELDVEQVMELVVSLLNGISKFKGIEDAPSVQLDTPLSEVSYLSSNELAVVAHLLSHHPLAEVEKFRPQVKTVAEFGMLCYDPTYFGAYLNQLSKPKEFLEAELKRDGTLTLD